LRPAQADAASLPRIGGQTHYPPGVQAAPPSEFVLRGYDATRTHGSRAVRVSGVLAKAIDRARTHALQYLPGSAASTAAAAVLLPVTSTPMPPSGAGEESERSNRFAVECSRKVAELSPRAN